MDGVQHITFFQIKEKKIKFWWEHQMVVLTVGPTEEFNVDVTRVLLFSDCRTVHCTACPVSNPNPIIENSTRRSIVRFRSNGSDSHRAHEKKKEKEKPPSGADSSFQHYTPSGVIS